MTSHIIAQDVTWSPWSRLFLQAGANYVLSTTATPASDYTQAILNAQNNYWMLNLTSGFVVDDKTDLNLGYFYYRANDYENISDAGVPYGAGAEDQGITAAIVRRLTKNIRVTLELTAKLPRALMRLPAATTITSHYSSIRVCNTVSDPVCKSGARGVKSPPPARPQFFPSPALRCRCPTLPKSAKGMPIHGSRGFAEKRPG